MCGQCCVNTIRILIDVINLSEQLAIYFLVKQNSNNDESTQQRFFFILASIGAASALTSLAKSLYLQTFILILIEIGELLAYIFVLDRSTDLIIVASVLFGVELILHIIGMFAEKLEMDKKEKKKNMRNTNRIQQAKKMTEDDKEAFPLLKSYKGRLAITALRFFMYALFNIPSILYLFLKETSRFRQTFYEIIILLTFFIINISTTESVMVFYWNYYHRRHLQCEPGIFYYYVGITFYGLMMPIAGIVLAAQEVNEATQRYGYDYSIYIMTLVYFSLVILSFVPGLICIHMARGPHQQGTNAKRRSETISVIDLEEEQTDRIARQHQDMRKVW